METLVKKIKYTAEIELLSGLYIGGTNTAMNIGGPDSFVIRNPMDNRPYIPGSTIKGKMRSLLELSTAQYTTKNGKASPSENSSSICGHLFGTAASNNSSQPSRIIVRDAIMVTPDEELRNTDMYLTESKTEVAIDRISAVANPRTIERVPKGVRFKFEAILNVFSSDNEEEMDKNLRKAIKLVEDDYIGGNGSRGYGHVKFNNLTANPRKTNEY